MYQTFRARLFINGSDSYQAEFLDGRTFAISRRELPGSGWIDTHEEITDRSRAEEQIAYMAEYDSLTDLRNRNLFQRALTGALEAADNGDQLAVFAWTSTASRASTIRSAIPSGMNCSSKSPEDWFAASVTREWWPDWEATSLQCCSVDDRSPMGRMRWRRW
jgi:hypothetical protein